MEKHPVLTVDGMELVREDLEDGWKLAGTIDDKVRAMFAQIPVEAGDRRGYVVPAVDGPLVLPNLDGVGAGTGTVRVQPFTGYRSPNNSETTRELLTGYFNGSVETVPTPLPTSGNHRWDLLYAMIGETDSDGESRLGEDPTTEDIGTGTYNTRHKAAITLAWVQGTPAAQATNPYPAANFPALPAPVAGMAHVALAYIHVFDEATPAAVTYSVDRIANVARVARINPQTGAISTHGAGLTHSAAGNLHGSDVKGIVTSSDTSSSYQWPRVAALHRPKTFLEPMNGGFSLYLWFDFFGSTDIGSGWSILTTPLFSPDSSLAMYSPIDWKNRRFKGRLDIGETFATFSNSNIGATSNVMPTRVPHTVTSLPPCFGTGNTIRSNGDFDAMGAPIVAGDWLVACYFPDVTGAGHVSDVALLVRKSASGGGYVKDAMYVAAREGVAGDIDGRVFDIWLDVTGQFFPFGF